MSSLRSAAIRRGRAGAESPPPRCAGWQRAAFRALPRSALSASKLARGIKTSPRTIRRCGRVLQRHGDGADGLEIFRYILADQAVAARCAADELSVDIFQRDGETVDLRLDGVFRVRLLLAHVRVKVAQLVIGKHVLQAFQRDGVAHLDKFAQRLARRRGASD